MAIYFKCAACRGVHQSQIQVDDRQGFDTTDFGEGNSEPCPTTGKQVTLKKKDLFWKDDPPKN